MKASKDYFSIIASYLVPIAIFIAGCTQTSKIFRLTNNRSVLVSSLTTTTNNRHSAFSFRRSGCRNIHIRKSIQSSTAVRHLSTTVSTTITMPSSSSSSSSSTSAKSKKGNAEKAHGVSIHWFRNGLRLHDNLPLHDCSINSKHLLPLYIIDPTSPFSQTPNRRAGIIRANFILESMKELNTKLIKSQKTRNTSQLVVVVGNPKDVLPKLIQQIGADALYYEREPASPVKQSDATVLDAIECETEECSIYGYDTHTLFPMDVYLAKCKNNVAPSSYGVFTKTFQKLGPVTAEIIDINKEMDLIPSLPTSISTKIHKFVKEEQTMQIIDLEKKSSIEILEDYLDYTNVKEKLANRNKSGLSFQGGEDVGLKLLDTMCSRSEWIWTFEKPKTKPTGLKVDTTGLSPYVKHGCVSPRTFYHELSKVYAKCTTPSKTLSKPPVSLHGQLMWREYNYLMGYSTPNFDKMENNPVARQIPWDDDPKLLQAWKNAQTGYPYIDAAITQLKETGWMHHLARHSVACFLTRGDLWQSWEKGAEFFEEELIDADWSINNFNWQW